MSLPTHYNLSAPLVWLWSLATLLSVLTILYGAYQLQLLQSSYQEQVKLANQELYRLANDSVRNSAAESSTALIKDCSNSERQQFENQLVNLKSLTSVEAENLTILFDRCGDFFARQKQLHTDRLQSSIEKFKSLQLAVTISDETNNHLSKWQQVGNLEVSRTALYKELVALQRELIISQKLNEPERATRQAELLEQVGNVQSELDTLGQELNQLLLALE